MENIVIYCKSYIRDLERVKIQAQSIEQYNMDKISYYVSCPKSDYIEFKKSLPNFVNLILDEDIFHISNNDWVAQQIIKSNFWKLEISENYVCLDSDSYFIRPFYISDFLYENNTPYTVIHEQKELFSWSVTKTNVLGFDPKDSFINDRQKIMNLFGRSSKHYDFGPSPIIWSSKVWKSLEEQYMIPNGLTFSNLIEYSPSEFSWYGEALLAFKAIEIYPAEPLFKVFHYPQQYIEYKQQNVTQEMIAQNYIGIIMQSNFNSPLRY